MSSIRDNNKYGSVGQFLRDSIKENSELNIVSAFFTIYAYHKLKDQLNAASDIKFLFGEPKFLKSLDPNKTNKRDFKIEDDQLIIPTESRLQQKSIAHECSEWIKQKVSIRSMVKPDFLHGKMYHIKNSNNTEEAILGSSNFTVQGLGLNHKSNIELNLIMNDRRDVGELKEWFDKLWNNEMEGVETEDVKDEVLKYLEKLYIDNEPEFIYFKTLYHIFEKYLDEQEKGGLLNEKTGFFESEIWNMLYDFQKDGVKGAINKILKHNGCIIADSVGLGKTFEALAVINYFERLNKDVLVLCPKKLMGNWTIYQARQKNTLNPFLKDRFNYSVLYHTDLGRIHGKSDANGIDLENFNWGAFDLVIIDESHNFRGNPMDKTKDDGSVRMNRAKWLMEKIIKEGVKTKVLMLSATPVNNNLRDLRNQISLITEGRNDAMFESTQIKDIALSLKNAQTQFTNWADNKKNPKRSVRQLIERLDSSFFKLLDELTIARSRKHIKSFYNMNIIGKFPERLKPISVYPSIDLKDRFFTYDALNKKILQYKLSVFNPSAYVKDEMQHKYEELAKGQVLAFKQSDREHFLIGMMKVNFLKRLESSIKSFEISMDRTIKKIEKLEIKINNFLKTRSKTQLEELEALEPDEDELEENADDLEQWQVGKKLKFDLADLHLDAWLADLRKDKEALNDIYNNASAIDQKRDAKLKDLKKLIEDKIKKPLNDNNKKVVVFTAFADTANYLYECLEDWVINDLKLNIALVAGGFTQTSFGRNDYSAILTNFSPLSKNRDKMSKMPQDGEIDILIATDCISEGQNLQDCDYLINYDIHWNPVRIIQRFGRIDRLGSKNDKIQLVNFWPTKDLDNYINLKERVEARMALVDVTATADDNVLATDQIEELIEDDLKYRNQQLKRLQNEVLDLEEMSESISLTDFTLDDFRVELLEYLKTNEAKLKNAPFGLYSVVPSPTMKHCQHIHFDKFSESEKEIIKPGVVFCLKQKGDSLGNEEVNPLQPYFLVYIRDDGTVRFNYTHAKHILEIYRLMCQGCKVPYEQLCDIFNSETNHGENMNKYTSLLEQAVNEIISIFKKRANVKLTTDRSAVLIPKSKQISEMNNFELVTWLIIK